MTSDSRDLLGNLMHFQAGILVALIRLPLVERSRRHNANYVCMALAAALLFLFFVANALYFKKPESFFSWRGALVVDLFSVLVLILHVIIESRKIKIGPIGTILMALGVLSYGLYCWHGALGPVEFLKGNFLKLLCVSLLLATASYRLLERPLLILKSKN